MAKHNPTPEKFLEGIQMGMVPIQAAGYAGYKNADKSCRDLLAKPEILAQYEAIKEQIRSEARITRKDIEAGVLDAINIAKLQADPLGMIRGYGELNKMQGNYAPEKRTLEITGAQKRIVTQLEDLSEQALVELIAEAGDEMIIDAEFYEIPNEVDENAETDDDA